MMGDDKVEKMTYPILFQTSVIFQRTTSTIFDIFMSPTCTIIN